jgi:ribA/ribD-fused uncharacterized protein
MIDSFRTQYYFLSNFFPCIVTYKGLTYQNSEAAFQAQKVTDIELQKQFTKLNASAAKRLGKQVPLRKDWESVKDEIMYEVVLTKFSQNESLKIQLLKTGNEELVEGNSWHDYEWGVCGGYGQNKLGKILMRVRKELRNEKSR